MVGRAISVNSQLSPAWGRRSFTTGRKSIFGPDGNFSGTPVMLDGLDYGILSAGDDSVTGNTGVTGHGPLIKNSVQFTLAADPLFALSELGTAVVFQYGTATTEPIITANCVNCTDPLARVPGPASLILLGSGMVGLALRRGKQR